MGWCVCSIILFGLLVCFVCFVIWIKSWVKCLEVWKLLLYNELLIFNNVIKVILGKWCFLVSICVLIKIWYLFLWIVVNVDFKLFLCCVLFWLICIEWYLGNRVCNCVLSCFVLMLIVISWVELYFLYWWRIGCCEL